MNRVMGRVDQEDEDGLDAQDKILKAMAERKMRENASYFAKGTIQAAGRLCCIQIGNAAKP
jgi:hypothetical protein